MALSPEDREELKMLVKRFKRQGNKQVICLGDTIKPKSKSSKSKTSHKISEKAVKEGVKEAVLKYLKEKVKDADGRIVERGELILRETIREVLEEEFSDLDLDNAIEWGVKEATERYYIEYGFPKSKDW